VSRKKRQRSTAEVTEADVRRLSECLRWRLPDVGKLRAERRRERTATTRERLGLEVELETRRASEAKERS
jgi:hypothetical protein